jgi:hypothetical protein
MKKLKLGFDKFEVLSEDAEGKLVSGFSEAFEGVSLDQMGTDVAGCTTNTNCGTANCVSGCGGSGTT